MRRSRTATATLVEVRVTVADGCLTLVVEDDGVGLGEDRSADGNGVANMARRASEFGGSFSIGPAGERGARMVWEASVNASG